MNARIISFVLLMLLFTFGCTPSTSEITTTDVVETTLLAPTTTPTLSPPSVRVTTIPDPEDTFIQYMTAWQEDDYEQMYMLLVSESRFMIDEEAFTKLHLDTVSHAAVSSGAITYDVGVIQKHTGTANIQYSMTMSSNLFGDLKRGYQMDMVYGSQGWQVIWHPGMILPELADGGRLQIANLVSERGLIFDRNGQVLVGPGEAYSIGIIPESIDADIERNLLERVGRAAGYSPEYLASLYATRFFGPGDYLSITDVPINTNLGGIGGFDAVVVSSFSGRYYFNKEAGSQAIGYISAIQPDEVTTYMRLGFPWTQRVPRDGVELWAEPYLGGERGGVLYLYDAQGTPGPVLAQKSPSPAYNVYTTLDQLLQKAAYEALLGLNGAVVVLERDTGRILAMASSPGFNPNLFEPTNYNARFTSPFFNTNAPLFNRATQGLYPLGSVFKIITMATALESGRFAPEDTLDCQHAFTELDNVTLYDWTYWDEVAPSGMLTLPQGLMRSCNPWFWHIGYDLYKAGEINQLVEMAKGFGLGIPTGIEQLRENPGQIALPNEPLAATNLAIGQGTMLVTPLQVARFIAAGGNGGTLYQPQLIERIESEDGEIVYQFEPIINGTLPISPTTLAVIQSAMTDVVRNPRGTAYRTLGAFEYAVAGKTSTSETGVFDPDAWFVAYTFQDLDGKPDISVVALVERAGEGSDYAAPVVRRVLEIYYFNAIRSRYSWEARIGVPEFLIPEPEETEETPEP